MQIYSHDVFKFAGNLNSQLHMLSFITNKNEAIRPQAVVLLSPEPRAESEKVKLCSRPPCQRSLSLSSSNLAYLRKALHESSQTFVEHALHELSPYSPALGIVRSLTSGLYIDKWMLELNQCDERKQNSLVQKFGLRRPQRFDAIQAQPLFLHLNQEKDRRKLCSEDGSRPTVAYCTERTCLYTGNEQSVLQ